MLTVNYGKHIDALCGLGLAKALKHRRGKGTQIRAVKELVYFL